MARILVVDDEPRILSLLHSLLKSKGYEVIPEHDGAAAIERIRKEPLDLVLSDIRMSPVDGMQVFRFARSEQPAAGNNHDYWYIPSPVFRNQSWWWNGKYYK